MLAWQLTQRVFPCRRRLMLLYSCQHRNACGLKRPTIGNYTSLERHHVYVRQLQPHLLGECANSVNRVNCFADVAKAGCIFPAFHATQALITLQGILVAPLLVPTIISSIQCKTKAPCFQPLNSVLRHANPFFAPEFSYPSTEFFGFACILVPLLPFRCSGGPPVVRSPHPGIADSDPLGRHLHAFAPFIHDARFLYLLSVTRNQPPFHVSLSWRTFSVNALSKTPCFCHIS